MLCLKKTVWFYDEITTHGARLQNQLHKLVRESNLTKDATEKQVLTAIIKTTTRGNRKLNSVLYYAVLCRIVHCPEIKKLYKDKIASGKTKQEAILYLMRKTAILAYSLLKSGEEYSDFPPKVKPGIMRVPAFGGRIQGPGIPGNCGVGPGCSLSVILQSSFLPLVGC
jgi:hypothetical protein